MWSSHWRHSNDLIAVLGESLPLTTFKNAVDKSCVLVVKECNKECIQRNFPGLYVIIDVCFLIHVAHPKQISCESLATFSGSGCHGWLVIYLIR